MQPAEIFIYIIMYIVKVVVAERRDHKLPACGYLGVLELSRQGSSRPPGLGSRRAGYGLQ